MWKVRTFSFVVFTNTFNIVPNIYNVSLNITMHLPELSRYTFNILYNVLIRQKIMRNSNVDKYRKLIVGMRRVTSTSPTTPPRLHPKQNAILRAHHRSSTKGCCNKKKINKMLAYWILLARQVRATTENDEQWTTCQP